jgi:hypothetical protein
MIWHHNCSVDTQQHIFATDAKNGLAGTFKEGTFMVIKETTILNENNQVSVMGGNCSISIEYDVDE